MLSVSKKRGVVEAQHLTAVFVCLLLMLLWKIFLIGGRNGKFLRNGIIFFRRRDRS